MVDDCTNFYGNSRRAGFHDPCGFVTDRYVHQNLRHFLGRSSIMGWSDFESLEIIHVPNLCHMA